MHKKMRAAAVVGATVALFAAACGSGNSSDSASGGSGNTQAKDITVWLMNGSAPDAVIQRVNAQFNQAHPNTKVKIQIQQWDGIQEKTTTGLASNNPPDVLEIGSTLVSKFADSGGLEDLSGKKADLGGDTWLQGLTDAGTLDGKLYGIPYYAGDRAVLYRKDLFAKAGITTLPTDRAGFVAAMAKLQAQVRQRQAVLGALLPGPVLVRGAAVHLGRGRRGRGPGQRPVEGHAGQPAVAGRAERAQGHRHQVLQGAGQRQRERQRPGRAAR